MSNLKDARPRKIALKDGCVHIHMTEEFAGRHEKEITFKGYTTPRDEFVAAFNALEPHVREILELPTSIWKDCIKITGVSFSISEGTGVEGAVITGQVTLETVDAPFCFNTPHMPFDQYAEGNNAKTMPTEAIEDLETLRREARKYLDEKEPQGDLFAGDGAAEPVIDGINAALDRDEPTPVGQLTDAVVDAVDGIVQDGLAEQELREHVQRIGKEYGFSKRIIEQVAGELVEHNRQGPTATDPASVVGALTAAKAAKAAKGPARSGKSNVVFLKEGNGKKPESAEEAQT